ncbi:hypothetical protein FRB90_004350, partial [Tulasnella sp. 427]
MGPYTKALADAIVLLETNRFYGPLSPVDPMGLILAEHYASVAALDTEREALDKK